MNTIQTKRISQFIALFFVLTLAVGGLYFGASYFTGGGLDYVLKSYETTGDADDVRKFFLKYQGDEADYHSACISFVAWGD